MGIENKVHDLLMGAPALKKAAKRLYQGVSVAVSRPGKSEGKIVRVTPNDGYEYLFGYYDKSPWDASGRYMLCLRVKDASHEVAPKTTAEIVLIDTDNNNSVKVVAKTHTWNVQQGCMAGWLGPNFNKEIFYNDCRHGKYCGVILNIETGKEKVLDMPVYTMSNDGKVALSLNFSRLHRLRPGYGYSNVEDKTRGEKVPKGACVWAIDIKSGKVKPILTYKQLFDFEHREDMEGAEHKVNHLMLSPDGKRFMVIHRWLKGGKKISRLLTCDIDGKNLYNLSDEDMVSHCCWKNNKEILAYCRKDGKNGYFLMKDKVPKYVQKWEWLTVDGHPSYSPDGKYVVTDTYPNRKRTSTLRVLSDTTSMVVAKVYAPFKYDNDVRCDLHPRWSRDGKKICFDGCFEGKRGVYVVEISLGNEKMGEMVKKIGKTKVLFVLNTCRRCGPTEVVFNIIKNLNYDEFDPVLLTIAEENSESNLRDILPYVRQHVFCKMKKSDIMSGKLDKLASVIRKIAPDVIHTTGVFSDYAVAKIASRKQVVTMHNYAPYDYMVKFGRVRGKILIKMQYYAARHAAKTVACSNSLSELYNKIGMTFDYIRNGIDVKKYRAFDDKNKLRKKLGVEEAAFVFIYTGQFITRKNISFALESFVKAFGDDKKKLFILLGDGPELKKMRLQYASYKNVVFKGRVSNVDEYLAASDVYVSASKSEGLPNGVLEAMACGLPVLLSDIPQHLEILESGAKCGYAFPLDDDKEIIQIMKKIVVDNKLKVLSMNAEKVVRKCFNSKIMSEQYQKIYNDIANKRRVTLYIGGLSGGGAERVTCNLANYLCEKGYNVDVITMSNKRDTYKLDDGVNRVCLLDEKERSNIWQNLRLRQKRLKEYVISNQDVGCYVVMLPITIFMLVRLKRLTNSKMIISERNNPKSYRLYEKMIMKYAAKRCDGLVVQTEEIGRWYRSVRNMVVIPNAINKDIIFPERKKVEKKIVAVGRLEKQKNYPMLIKAFAIFTKKHPEYTLEIYGQGGQEKKIKNLIRKYNLSDKIKLMGYVENASEKIASAACFVMTSNFEGMPNALIEAMCIGVPCIATDCDGGGARALIRNGENGVLVKKGDAERFVAALDDIVNDAERAEDMSRRAKKIGDKLSYAEIYCKWDRYIKSVDCGEEMA